MTSDLPTIGLISLGCAKNLVDTERLVSVLLAMGYAIELNEENFAACDLIVVNTCGFIDPAVAESLETIGEVIDLGPKIIVMGCLGAREQLIMENYPQVYAVFGPGRRAAVLRCIVKAVGMPPAQAQQQIGAAGVTLTPAHYAYLKIAEGCRHHCTFCIIPKLRGDLRSREPGAILAEARGLVEDGVKELLIIAQDSSDYGLDLKPAPSLSSLCRSLADLKVWLRVHYVYPGPEAARLVELMADGLVLPYLDVPLQHASPAVLKRMARPGSLERSLRQIENWRQICPDVAIRSTFITGFPGESEEDFELLLDFLKEARLDRVGCFPYSDVEGARANAFDGEVDPEEREERAERLMEVQQEISYSKLEERVGQTYDILIDSVGENGEAVGRSKYEAPDVDGVVIITDGRGLKEGSMIRATVTGHDEHDLFARPAAQNIGFSLN